MAHELPRPWFRATGVLLLGSLCVAAAVGEASRSLAQDVSAKEIEALRRENQFLRRQAELASAKDFYLILDPKAPALSLTLHGVVLDQYPVIQIEVAERQVAWVSRSAAEGWQERVWTHGNLVPPRARDRVEIKAPPPGAEATEEPAYIPPPPEEAFPVPPRYGIRFEGGLYVELHSATGEASPGFAVRLSHWWQDVKEALRAQPTDRIRIRLTLSSQDFQAIYRSLPPDCSLLVLPPN